jgi:3-oxo-4,17-pregnadiene-20-carboxyl-CoA hydratase alpha subunit
LTDEASQAEDAEKAAFYEKLLAYEGVSTGEQVGHDEVNLPMIRHWVDAMGDKNPIYTDADAAKETVHGEIIAPPVMLQAWVMRGLNPRPTTGGSKQDELMNLLDGAGFSSVVATNCEQEYDRMLHVGDHLRTRNVIDSISEEKHTALGIGHFVTTRVEYETLDGEPVGRQLFRILKFRPGTGKGAPAPAADEGKPKPKRPRPALTLDNKWWFDAAADHRLMIQRCSQCQTLRHPPRPRCDQCGSYEWNALEASGKGTVYSFVVAHYPQVPAFDYPLPIALIDLEEGTRLVADLVDVAPEDVKVGMAVAVVWQDHDDELTLPGFKPAGG